MAIARNGGLRTGRGARMAGVWNVPARLEKRPKSGSSPAAMKPFQRSMVRASSPAGSLVFTASAARLAGLHGDVRVVQDQAFDLATINPVGTGDLQIALAVLVEDQPGPRPRLPDHRRQRQMAGGALLHEPAPVLVDPGKRDPVQAQAPVRAWVARVGDAARIIPLVVQTSNGSPHARAQFQARPDRVNARARQQARRHRDRGRPVLAHQRHIRLESSRRQHHRPRAQLKPVPPCACGSPRPPPRGHARPAAA